MGWLHSEDYDGKTSYSAFASDIDYFSDKMGHGPSCPVCKKIISIRKLYSKPVAVGDEPMAKFEYTCECAAELVIFNT